MIGVYFQGRLGNQLFQYAFALSASKRLNTSFFMDERLDRFIINNYFELGSYNFFKAGINKLLFGKNKPEIETGNGASYAENIKKLDRDNCFYKGYYQSDLYFNDVKEQLKTEFSIKEKYRIDVRKALGITNEKPLLAIHVRRSDYLIFGDESMGGKDLSLPLNYYTNCLSAVKDLEKYNIVFVTDDKEFVKANFNHLNPIISSSKDPIVDFQVLLNADVLVLANSSFSWWAAYLSQEGKKIFAPEYWLGFLIKKEYPVDIIPASWEKIEVLA